jgi:hypothetical protein
LTNKSLILERFGIVSDTLFLKPLAYSESSARELAVKAIEKLHTAGLVPSGIVSTPGDHIFGHSFSFNVLAGKCTFTLNSAGVQLRCIDALQKAEMLGFRQFVIDCTAIVGIGENVPTHFQTYIHATFPSDSDLQDFKTATMKSLPEGSSFAGFILYCKSGHWQHEIRMQLDRSAAVPKALFVLVGTRVDGLITEEKIGKMFKGFEDVGERLGFTIDNRKYE